MTDVIEMKTQVETNESFSCIGQIDTSDFKPGQRYPTPAPANGDRVFYETLFQQRPDSEMAQEWCVYYGVLEKKEALKVNDVILKRKRKNGSVVSPPRNIPSNSTVSKTQKKTKAIRIISNSLDDDGKFKSQ